MIDVDFTGNLSHTTMDKIFLNTPVSKEWLKGDVHAHILLDQLKDSTFQGILEGKNLSFPFIQKIPLNINDISLRADNKNVIVDSLTLTCQDNHLSVNGDVNISESGFFFDLDMTADGLDGDTIRKILNIGDKKSLITGKLDFEAQVVAKVLSPLASELPEFHAAIKDGRFNLVGEDDTVLIFSDVQTEISCISKEIDIKMNGSSNICEDISVNVGFDQKHLKGKGEVELKNFQPQTLINRFLPNATYRFTKPININKININKMSVGLKTDGPNDLQVDIDEINITADYDGIPIPLQINDGRVHYERENINLIGVGGTFGSSAFSELTSRIGLGQDATIEIQSERVLVFFKEVYPWISSFDKEG